MLEGLVTRLREELQIAKNVQPKEESSPVPTLPPPAQVDPIQSISFAPLPMSKLVPEVIVTAPIVAV
jgi:hypothetical protein